MSRHPLSRRGGPAAPDALPLLGRGSHRRPSEGSCLMEYVSVLAGTHFTDRPRCTHPLVARLARMVNDTVDDSARHRLIRIAPELLGTRTRDARLVSLVLGHLAVAGLEIDADDARLHHVVRRARAYSDLRRRRTTARRLVRRGVLRVALIADVPVALQRTKTLCRRLDDAERDRRLVGLLTDTARSVRTHLGHPRLTATATL